MRILPLCHRRIVLAFGAIILFVYLRLTFLHLFSSYFLSSSNVSYTKFERIKQATVIRPRVNCESLFRGDNDLLKKLPRKKWRKRDPKRLEMSCEAIKRRNEFGREDEEAELSKVEREMPIAFARVVYKDYLFLEAELLANYAVNNWYCYAIDSKSDWEFKLRMRHLASCFDNVIIADTLFNISPQGYNMSNALMECVKLLAEGTKWKYLITLQNHDMQARTNREMAQIFTWLDGTNDVEVEVWQPFTKKRIQYYHDHFNWTFEALNLFRNETKNRRTDLFGRPLELNISKGYFSASLTREFVDFMTNELDLTKILEQLNLGIFGVDEHLWQTLHWSEALNAPGGFPQRCFEERMERRYPFITRFAMWEGNCRSGNWRHGVCVFGLQDLAGPDSILRNVPHLFVNKMMPEVDFDAVLCWHNWMRNRRKNSGKEGKSQLREQEYRDWPQTQYQQERWMRREGIEQRTKVDCELGMISLMRERTKGLKRGRTVGKKPGKKYNIKKGEDMKKSK